MEISIGDESVYGLQRAEQPLKMEGHWECEFTVYP